MAIPATAILWSGVAVYMAMATFVGAKSPPDGAALRSLETMLAANDWAWSLAGIASPAGALLEISAA